MEEKISFLQRLKKAINPDEKIVIITHDFPDPDAIAASLGMSVIIRLLGMKSGSIYYTGEVSHPQTKVMINLLSIVLTNYEKDPFESGVQALLLDLGGIGEHSNQARISQEDVKIIAVIDHHKTKSTNEVLNDTRFIGATSSIIWEYLRELKYDFTSDEGKALATALLVGIKVDTQDLLSDTTGKIDTEAYEDLRQYIDRQKIVSILNYPLPEHFFELRAIANMPENKHFENSTLIAGVGLIAPAKRDALPVIADEFLRMSSVQTSIIFAIIEDYLDISVRSNSISIDVGDFLNNIFGTGGGKRGAGRAKIPLNFFNPDELPDILRQDIWGITKRIVVYRILKNLKGEQ